MVIRVIRMFSILLIFPVLPFTLSAADPLRESLRPIAQQLLDDLKNAKQMKVKIGEFQSPLRSDYGPGIATTLAELLNGLQTDTVVPDAAYKIQGKYELDVTGKNDDQKLTAKVTAQLLDQNDNLVDGSIAIAEIVDNSMLAGMAGLSISFPPLANNHQKNQLIIPVLHRLQDGGDIGFIDQSKIRPKPGSPYGVEIIAISKDSAPQKFEDWSAIPSKKPRFESGQPFVDLYEDEVYAIRIFNEDYQDAAVIVEIDGFSVFAFSSAEFRTPMNGPKYSYYIIEKSKSSAGEAANSRIVSGWHITNDQVQSFLVTKYGDGASARPAPESKSSGRTGTITVSFATAIPPDSDQTMVMATRGPVETGFGPVVNVVQKEAIRKIGRFNDVVTIRYIRQDQE